MAEGRDSDAFACDLLRPETQERQSKDYTHFYECGALSGNHMFRPVDFRTMRSRPDPDDQNYNIDGPVYTIVEGLEYSFEFVPSAMAAVSKNAC